MKNIKFSDFHRINKYEWEIARDFQPGMKVPLVFFADEEMIKDSLKDRSIQQAINAAKLPGVVKRVCVMPDMHQGYGFPIGGVAATSVTGGVVSPSAIGYDINCGVRLLSSELPRDIVSPLLNVLLQNINSLCPSGVGKSGRIKVSTSDLKDVCRRGADWAEQKGYLGDSEKDCIEDRGKMKDADPAVVSSRALERGKPQLGSLGAGNHFIEVDFVNEIFDDVKAKMFGLTQGMIAVQIHSGSRGFGHQICTDYVRRFHNFSSKFNYNLPDKELVCAPVESNLGREYLSAMRCAANYAFVNRQILACSVIEAFELTLEKTIGPIKLQTVYDLAHNIGKIECFEIDGEEKQLCVHRKGATRSLGPGHPNLPPQYKDTGQPVLVPGSMGTSSWVLAGTSLAENKSFNSCSHGAGRVLSRSQARKLFDGNEVVKELRGKGIYVRAGSMRGLAEEAPQVYKKVGRVIHCIEGAGLATRVAMLSPIAVLKG